MSIRDEERQWFIDALDADGGIAFASFRWMDDRATEGFGEEHAVIVSAPHFHPTPISSRALSLGAINQGAQTGVYIDGREVGFESLDQLVEFVRKAYVGGGAGGAAPNPEVPPVPPEGPRGEGPPDVERQRPAEPGVIHETSRAIVDWLTSEADVDHLVGDTSYSRYGGGAAYDGHQLIAHTAISIGCSLFERMPYPDDPVESQSHWFATAARLQHLLVYIDVSEFGMDAAMEQRLASVGSRLVNDQRRWARHQPPSEQVEDTYSLARATYSLIIHGDLDPPFRELYVPLRHHPRFRYDSYGVPGDVFNTLAALPIPSEVNPPEGLNDASSVADFLAYCCATSSIVTNSPMGPGLLVFAAFCLAAPARTHHLMMNREFRPSWIRGTYRDAMEWLSQQFRGKLPDGLRDMVIGER